MGYRQGPEVPSYIDRAIAKQDADVQIISNSLNRVRSMTLDPKKRKNAIMDSEIRRLWAAQRLAEQIRSEFDMKPKYKRARIGLWKETKAVIE